MKKKHHNNKLNRKQKHELEHELEQESEKKLEYESEQISNDKKHNFSNIKSVNNYNCIGPCYPPNTIYYNPSTLTAIKSKYPSCPINKTEIKINGEKKYIYADKCNESNINGEYLNFDIFDDTVQIANTPNNFLKQIYGIQNISDVVIFLNNSIGTMELYSQKRVLKAIYEVYYKYVEFPKLFFLDKICKILSEIYNLKKISSKDIIHDLDLLKSNTHDIYTFLIKKYS